MMKKIIPKQLGELLIDSNLITQQQLEESLVLQKEKGGLLGQILVSLHYITEEAIAQALTAQYGFPYLPLAGYEIDAEVAKIIPEHVAKQYGLIAVDRVGSILTVAMSNPLNSQAVEDVEMITHYKVQVFVTTSTDVATAIKGVYKA
jgi:type IV pilus assembly protein PilB